MKIEDKTPPVEKVYVLTLNEDELKYIKYYAGPDLATDPAAGRLYRQLSVIPGSGADYNADKCFKEIP